MIKVSLKIMDTTTSTAGGSGMDSNEDSSFEALNCITNPIPSTSDDRRKHGTDLNGIDSSGEPSPVGSFTARKRTFATEAMPPRKHSTDTDNIARTEPEIESSALEDIISSLSVKRVATICRDIFFTKISSSVVYGMEADISRPSTIADMELSSLHCLLLALLHSLVEGDVTTCVFLGNICQLFEKLKSRQFRNWLLEDLSFPRNDIENAMTVLVELVADGTLKLPIHVLTLMTSLAKKYEIPSVQFSSLSEEVRCYLATQLENAVINNNPREILNLSSEGADVSWSSQSGDTLLHLAARTGCNSSIAALGILNVDLEVVNSSNATPLEEAVRYNLASSVKALIMAGARLRKRLPRGDTYLHIAAAGGYNEALMALLEGGMDKNKKNQLGETPLFQSFKAGNIQGMELLLGEEADTSDILEIKLTNGDSIIHSLASSGNVKVLKLLNDKNIKADIKNNNGLTPLHVANNPSVVKMLLRMGVDVDTVDNTGCTPLMSAVRNGKEDIISALLLNKADLKIKDKQGQTALHYAVEGGCIEAVSALLDSGARIDDRNNNGDTPIYVAAVNNKPDILQLLVEKGDLLLKDSKGDGLLHHEARRGHHEFVKVLLDAGVIVNMEGENQRTALHHAANEGQTAVVNLLLAVGAEVDMRDYIQMTALHLAAARGHTKVVKVLLEAGSRVDLRDSDQNSALHLAAAGGHTEVVKALLEAGSRVDLGDSHQNSALHLAAAAGHTEVVKALLQAGSRLDLRASDQDSALHLAAAGGHSGVVTVLLDAGSALDMRGWYKRTALHSAVASSNTEVVTLLLGRGANPSAKDSDEKTPLMLAAKLGSMDMVRLLVEGGADVKAKDSCGFSAYGFANNCNNREIIRDYLSRYL